MRIFDVPCVGCGCLCDDITLTIQGDRIVAVEQACPEGEAFFRSSRPPPGPACMVRGRAASLAEGLDQAAGLLGAARFPLVFGLGRSTCESQRLAVELACRLGAAIDPDVGDAGRAALLAFQRIGAVEATLGEIRHRAQLVLVWGADPAVTHPRHFARYSLWPAGQFVPRGRADRTLVTVGPALSDSGPPADLALPLAADRQVEALWTLRALAKGLELEPRLVREETGVELDAWRDLVQRMKAVAYGAILYGPRLAAAGPLAWEGLLRLVQEMNDHTRLVAVPLGPPGNLRGAENVLAWRTGFPLGVRRTPGGWRYGPVEYSAPALLARRECDAALALGADLSADFGPQAREHLAAIPTVVVDSRPSALDDLAGVAFRVPAFGISSTGTVYRSDDVPLPLRGAVPSPVPTEAEVLAGLVSRIRVSS
jgi:formylmethanofuran dehydrogenase subunit B